MTCTIRAFALVFGVLFSLSGLAAAVLEPVNGEVTTGAAAGTATAEGKGERIQPGSIVVTATSPAASIAPSAPPAAVGASFSETGPMTIAQAGEPGIGASKAAEAAEAGGIAFRAVMAVGVAAALAALLLNHGDSASSTGTTGTH